EIKNTDDEESSENSGNQLTDILQEIELEVDPRRKFQRDGVYKKLKTHFMKWLLKDINKLLKRNAYLTTNPKKFELKKLPNEEFTSNVKIDFNKQALKMTLAKIFTSFWGNDQHPK